MSVSERTTLLGSTASPLLDLCRENNGRSLRDNIDLDTYWVVRVVDTEDKSGDKNFHAHYFDFPQSQGDLAETSSNKAKNWKWTRERVGEIKARQNLGVTRCSIKEIRKKRLYHLLIYIYHGTNTIISTPPRRIVGTAQFHFWHSHQFSIYLALLILDKISLEHAKPQLRELLNNQFSAIWQ